MIRPTKVEYWQCGYRPGRGWVRCTTPEACIKDGCERERQAPPLTKR